MPQSLLEDSRPRASLPWLLGRTQQRVDALGNLACRLFPGKPRHVVQSAPAQRLAQRHVRQDAFHGGGHVFNVQRVEIQRAGLQHFRDRRRVGRQHRATTGLCFQGRNAEALVQRRKHKRRGALVLADQFVIAQATQKADARVTTGQALQVVVAENPAGATDDAQLQIIVAAQQQERLNHPAEILVGAGRRHRQQVILLLFKGRPRLKRTAHGIGHHEDFLLREFVELRDLALGEGAHRQQRLDPRQHDRRHGPVEQPEGARVAFRVTHIGDVVVGRDLVAVQQRRGAAQRNQQRVALTAQVQRQVQLLPQVAAVTADALHVEGFGALVHLNAVGGHKHHVVAQLLEGQADLFGEALNATQFLGQETCIDHNHCGRPVEEIKGSCAGAFSALSQEPSAP